MAPHGTTSGRRQKAHALTVRFWCGHERTVEQQFRPASRPRWTSVVCQMRASAMSSPSPDRCLINPAFLGAPALTALVAPHFAAEGGPQVPGITRFSIDLTIEGE